MAWNNSLGLLIGWLLVMNALNILPAHGQDALGLLNAKPVIQNRLVAAPNCSRFCLPQVPTDEWAGITATEQTA